MRKTTRNKRDEYIYRLWRDLGLTYTQIADVLKVGKYGDLHPIHVGRIIRRMTKTNKQI